MSGVVGWAAEAALAELCVAAEGECYCVAEAAWCLF